MSHAWASVLVNEFFDRFMVLKRIANDVDETRVVSSSQLDSVWCIALVYTREYKQFCDEVVGFFVHRHPKQWDGESHPQRYHDTLMLYRLTFDCEPIEAIWPARPRAADQNDVYSDWLRTRPDFPRDIRQAKRKTFTAQTFEDMDKSRRKHDAPRPFKLFVKTLTGTNEMVEATPENTVAELKETIFKKIGTVVEQQRLIFAGRQMDDEKPLQDYNLQSGSTLHMVLRLLGC
jgi:hypothetical protein